MLVRYFDTLQKKEPRQKNEVIDISGLTLKFAILKSTNSLVVMPR